MNVGQIKAFLGDQNSSVNPSTAIKKQLQEEGLKQAAEMMNRQATSVSMSASQTSIGLRIFSGAMSNSVNVDGKNPSPESLEKREKGDNQPASLFDFEKVAKNVMRFVGGVIEGAAKSGADESRLNSLFGQARSGVAKGIAMAEKDIGRFMNEDIRNGISRSRELIGNEIDSLESRLLSRGEETSQVSQLAMSALNSNTGSLLIRTRDGDELTLRFENVQQFTYNQQTRFTSSQDTNTDVGSNGQQGQTTRVSASESVLYQFFQRSGVSFSLEGELDEDELKSIADLVGRANDLADTFFAGDLDKAFEDALNLGFDDKELVGYALQLNSNNQAEVVQTYESIKHYSDEQPDANKYGNAVSPVSQYIDKMLNTMDAAGKQLESGEQYNTMINGLIGEMKDVQVPDLISAINRFHMFNRQLLDAMPATAAEQTDKPDTQQQPDA
ncbi:DUF5610 domain-containing protein [Alteromonas halophila]|uniref:DUF4367 domain-containing protein n=1 Tax=Alteromonas halophila TaxID=516698 RepID=A0A918JN53_9ALTE|nr:DUF5610 domain-containing protein [Alteromonas halophila]GGW91658.1 hypothetical protein GCM10007391_27380 [Alteromonas halophila]